MNSLSIRLATYVYSGLTLINVKLIHLSRAV